MSWSLEFKGTSKGITEELDQFAETLTEPSKSEYMKALPHLKGVVDQNFGTDSKMQLTANGHGLFDGEGDQTQGTLQVHLRFTA